MRDKRFRIFAVLLPETPPAAAALVAERLRAAVAQPGSETGRTKAAVPPYTISIGVSSVRGFESLQDLMRRADAALYSAKALGRNRAASETETEV